MTVSELIAALRDYPQDAKVWGVYEGTGSAVTADRLIYVLESNTLNIDADVMS